MRKARDDGNGKKNHKHLKAKPGLKSSQGQHAKEDLDWIAPSLVIRLAPHDAQATVKLFHPNENRHLMRKRKTGQR